MDHRNVFGGIETVNIGELYARPNRKIVSGVLDPVIETEAACL
jgi:hypothetical protein